MATGHERKIFDGLFPKFYDITVSLFSLFMAKRFRKEAIGMLGIRQGAKILDIACGTGDFTMLSAEKAGKGGNVLAIDLSEKMINVAKKKSKNFPQIKYAIRDFTDMRYNSFFNSAVIGFGAHEVSDESRQRMYRGAYKALKKGGRLLVFDFIAPKNIILKPFFFLFVKLLEPHGSNYLKEDHQKALGRIGFKRVSRRINMYMETAIYQKPS